MTEKFDFATARWTETVEILGPLFVSRLKII